MMQDPLSPHRVSGEGVSTGDMEDKARGHGTSVQEKTNIKLRKKRRKRAADFRIFRWITQAQLKKTLWEKDQFQVFKTWSLVGAQVGFSLTWKERL